MNRHEQRTATYIQPITNLLTGDRTKLLAWYSALSLLLDYLMGLLYYNFTKNQLGQYSFPIKTKEATGLCVGFLLLVMLPLLYQNGGTFRILHSSKYCPFFR
jgi:hypothetical protein